MALAAYFDDSREKWGGFNYWHTIAGYLAPLKFWEQKFTLKWDALIASAPHRISEFKTSDCRQGKRQFSDFEGWNSEERTEFYIRTVDVLTDPALPISGVAMTIHGSVATDDKQMQELEHLRLERCLMAAMENICGSAKAMGTPQHIQFFCDNQPGIRGRLADAWSVARKNVEPWYGAALSELDFEDSRKLRPIQAADLLAYEARKDARDRIVRPEAGRSKALERLIGARPHVGLYSDYDTWKDHCANPDENAPYSFAFLSPPPLVRGNTKMYRIPILHDPRPGVAFPFIGATPPLNWGVKP
jgi:hypothetical protein